MKQHTPIAICVSGLGLAVAALASAHTVGLYLLDSDGSEWLIELHRFVLKISMTGVVFLVVSAILFPFVFVVLNLLRPSILLRAY